MSRFDTRNFALMIGLGVALLIVYLAVVFVIDAHFSLDPWRDDDADMLWYFPRWKHVLPRSTPPLPNRQAGREKSPLVSPS